jgi:hypothetical protein
MFAHLDECRKQWIEEIDRVLQRIALGTYGLCERCGELIPVARLRALPTAWVHMQCADDAQGPPLDTFAEAPLRAPRESAGAGADDHLERLSLDIRDSSDEEVEDYIREHLREDGRIDAHELRITYRAGVITLEGTVPSEEQHQIFLQYVIHFARVQEVADRLVIDALVWEREARPARGRGALLLRHVNRDGMM